MYLVDTSVVSEARLGGGDVAGWIRSVRPENLFLSVLTLGEITRAIVRRRETDRAAASKLAEWLQILRRDHSAQILPVTDEIAIEWGRIAASRPNGEVNGLIAATAIVHDLIVVTRNVEEFSDTRVSALNPWSSE